MRKRFVAPVLLVAILVGVGLTGRSRPEGGAADTARGEVAKLGDERERASRGATVSEVRATLPEGVRTRPSSGKPAPLVLTEEESGLLAATCELQLMAEGTALELTGGQWTALAKVALEVQAIRHNYEAQIATATKVTPGHYRVEVPVYAQTGDALRERFQTNLRAALGEPAAAAVIERLGARLEGYFAGFGVSVQTIEIAGGARGARADYEVTRTVQYWDSVAGRDELTTRRETHVPAWEDPAGERWGALLARIES